MKDSVFKIILLSTLLTATGCSGEKDLGRDPDTNGEACAALPSKPTSIKKRSLGKVRLDARAHVAAEKREFTSSSMTLESLSAGTELSVLVNNACLKRKGAGRLLSHTILQNSAIKNTFSHRGKKRALVWKLPSQMTMSELTELAEKDDCVEVVGSEGKVRLTALPDDPYYSELDALPAIDYETSYDQFWGVSGITADVVVAIIDTGIDITHEDLVANIWVNTAETAGDGIDDDGNGYIDDINGYSIATDQEWPIPNDHATAVAGLIGGIGDNDIGVVGVMKSHVQMMSLDIFGTDTEASLTDAANAVLYAEDNGAQVINMSFGGSIDNAVFEAAIDTAITSGLTLVAAAGNDHSKLTTSLAFYPASYGVGKDGLITVGATNTADTKLTNYSNYGADYVEIAAPGSELSSSHRGLFVLEVSDSYNRIEGTSFSAPLVAGAVAASIGLIDTRGYGAPTPAQLETLVTQSSRKEGTLYNKITNCRHLDLQEIADKIDIDYP